MSRRSVFRRISMTSVLLVLTSFFFESTLWAQGQPAVMSARDRMAKRIGMGSGQTQGASAANGAFGTSPTNATTLGGNPYSGTNSFGATNVNASGAINLNGEGGLGSLASLFQMGSTEITETVGVYDKHEGAVTSLQLTSDGMFALTGSVDKTAQLWKIQTDVVNGKERLLLLQDKLFKTEFNHKLGVTDVAFSPDESFVLTASYDRTIRLWDKDEENIRSYLGAKDRVWGVAVAPNGYYVAGVTNNGEILIWQSRPPEIVGRFMLPKTDDGKDIPVYDVNFDSTGEYLVVACADGSVRLWYVPAVVDKNNLIFKKLLEKEEAATTEQTDDAATDAVRLGEFEFADSGEKRQFGESLIIRGHGMNGDQLDAEPFVYSAVFSDDNSCILTAGRDKTARIWDSRTGEELCRFVGHTGAVRKAIFFGNNVLTASDDGTIRVWNYSLASSGYGSGTGGDPTMMGSGYPGGGDMTNPMMNPATSGPGMMNSGSMGPTTGPGASGTGGYRGPVGMQQSPSEMPASAASSASGTSAPPASPMNPGPMGPASPMNPGPMGPGAIIGPPGAYMGPGSASSGSTATYGPALPQRETGVNKATEILCFKVEGNVGLFSLGVTSDGYYVLGGGSDGLVRVWRNPMVASLSEYDPNAAGYGTGGYGIIPGAEGGYGAGGYGTGTGYGSGGYGNGTNNGTGVRGYRNNSPSGNTLPR